MTTTSGQTVEQQQRACARRQQRGLAGADRFVAHDQRGGEDGGRSRPERHGRAVVADPGGVDAGRSGHGRGHGGQRQRRERQDGLGEEQDDEGGRRSRPRRRAE
jgi:hypothetical protein